jgi:hypothetical protein
MEYELYRTDENGEEYVIQLTINVTRYYGGSSATYWQPADDVEIEWECYDQDGKDIDLAEAEFDVVNGYVYDNYEPEWVGDSYDEYEQDYDPDPYSEGWK